MLASDLAVSSCPFVAPLTEARIHPSVLPPIESPVHLLNPLYSDGHLFTCPSHIRARRGSSPPATIQLHILLSTSLFTRLVYARGPPTQASWHSISSRGQRGLGYPSQGACSPGDLCGSSCHCFSVPCQEPGVVRGQDTPLGIWFPRASLVATVLLGHLVLIVRICARSAAPEGPGLVRPSSGGVAIVSG